MTKPNIQIGDQVREMTQEEYDRWQADGQRVAATLAEENAAREALVIAKESAKAKLAALGLTADEIEALVG